MKKLNLTIDGNFFTHSIVNAISGKHRKDDPPFLSKQSDKNHFISVLSSMFGGLLEAVRGCNSRIVLCIDSRSFRKDIEIEENEGYKSGRVKTDDVDWTSFYELYDRFAEAVKTMGGTVLRIPAAEADDLIFLSTQYLLERGESCVIVSSDKDLKQLVRKHKSEYCVQYSTAAEKLYVPHDFEESPEESLFSVTETSYDLILHFAKKKSVQIERINAQAEALAKVLTGDKGDDVPPVHFREDIFKSGLKKGQVRQIKFNATGAAQVIGEIYNPFSKDTMCGNIWEDEALQESVAGMILRINQGTDNKDNRALTMAKLKRNLRLVWLDQRIIPQSILDEFEQVIFSPAKKFKETKVEVQVAMGAPAKINFFESDVDFDSIF